MAMPTVVWVAWVAAQISMFIYACREAFNIRLYAVKEYGLLIHEFDPWFNFRATKYLAENGWTAFFHWYDYMSWYPVGRPVGTTIYPGMQITSVVIWKVLPWFGINMSLNDVCVYVPAWFGVVATTFLALLTWECAGFMAAGTAAALFMSIIPAHIMRSVAGGYDNESVAITAMCMTFYFWCRSLRNDNSWWIGAFAGLAYVYMVMVWGGYIFVLNMVGAHAIAVVFTGCFTSKLHRAYTLFYVIGTAGATRVPVVGLSPLKSLEQLGPFGVFVIMQVLEFCEIQRRKKGLTSLQTFKLRIASFSVVAAALAGVAMLLYPTGYFGPLSARVRGLFVQHTRTGNPLVDSVAEHQPASQQAYWQYLHYACYWAPIGFLICLARVSPIAKVSKMCGASEWWWNCRADAKFFLVLYGIIGYFFSLKMVRLVLLMGPITSALAGIALGAFGEWGVHQLCLLLWFLDDSPSKETEDSKDAAAGEESDQDKKKSGKAKKGASRASWLSESTKEQFNQMYSMGESLSSVFYESFPAKIARIVFAIFFVYYLRPYALEFKSYCHQLAHGMSNPSIVFKAHTNNGQVVVVNDYLEAYYWLRDKTPKEARVMAWWDYGYQITGIGERTTLADGNTWNHEHIATIAYAPKSKASASWENTELTTQMWAIIRNNDVRTMRALVKAAPTVVHVRAEDGRGPLWWAYEFQRPEMRKILLDAGCDAEAKDKRGMRARDVAAKGGKQSKGKERRRRRGRTESLVVIHELYPS
ncbi:hypothetical protein GUITHDRAFT_118589 [Guillardia theta CCMP2712]|uniref:dolichyl-diphosphooligosaccharide--protein glycotransferase n=1 Tax=Guillardia theta (strain CCMP2712) TaxID=905079 RepID=L1IH51_GUITC|nr:hypothetical protein GUITHDRAFT_118589 [Guillardia theta CCMP2712]EKX35244.1 hypothetical protein GUITHDRAFT_118589 [Guillardia theta CCMP2712]|eukprot:XP_005822224.1 hypothetical protein GUITHDRAFT_118589 [Guillardia theta CCMP2712]